MNWTAEQQRLLGAMGYELMARVAPGSPARQPPRPGPVADTVDALETSAVAASFPELERALRRAAGDRDVSELVIDLARLRREPALKRAIWPTLRALRRSH